MILFDPIGDRAGEKIVIVRAAEAAGIDVLRLSAAARAADHVRRDLRDFDVGAWRTGFAEVQFNVGDPNLDGHVNGRIRRLALRAGQEASTPCSLRPISAEEPDPAGTVAEAEREPWRWEQASAEAASRQTVGPGRRPWEATRSSCSEEAEARVQMNRRRQRAWAPNHLQALFPDHQKAALFRYLLTVALFPSLRLEEAAEAEQYSQCHRLRNGNHQAQPASRPKAGTSTQH